MIEELCRSTCCDLMYRVAGLHACLFAAGDARKQCQFSLAITCSLTSKYFEQMSVLSNSRVGAVASGFSSVTFHNFSGHWIPPPFPLKECAQQRELTSSQPNVLWILFVFRYSQMFSTSIYGNALGNITGVESFRGYVSAFRCMNSGRVPGLARFRCGKNMPWALTP